MLNPHNEQKVFETISKKNNIYEKLVKIDTSPISYEKLLTTHHKDYVDSVFQKCKQFNTCILSQCPDVIMRNPESFKAALIAAGSGITAVDTVMNKKSSVNRVFCNVRPPGHHAEFAKAMGFCVFNDIAIAANHALTYPNINKVVIVDYDAHFGNGTQNIFSNNQNVLYISLHQSAPFYPNDGFPSQTGINNNTINKPLPIGTSDSDFLNELKNIYPKIIKFNPDLIFISCGFDAHEKDDISEIYLSTECYAQITTDICNLSEKVCEGKIISMLEVDTIYQHLVSVHIIIFYNFLNNYLFI